ncbi:MAG: histidine kinase dimerization/phosphoacceptor domain -containing protein [Dissulfurispiraceae bacterium]|jgi:two-component sensor histidine kinase/HAMP domain-containing protein
MKLKAKFTLIVSVFVITMFLLTALLAFSHYKKSIKETIAKQQFLMVSSLADEIDSKLLTAQQHLIAVAKTAPPDIMQHPEKAQAFLDNAPSLHTMFDSHLFLFTPSGKIFVDSPYTPGKRGFDLSFREYMIETLKTKKPYISDPLVSSMPHKNPVIAFTSPLFDGKGKITGILAGSIDLMRDNFLGRLSTVKIGQAGYFYLTAADRTLIMHPDKKRILTKQAPGLNRLYDRAIEGFEGTDDTMTSYGIKMVSSSRRMKAKNWILLVNYPQAEAYRPIQVAGRYFLIIAVIVIIAVFFIISLIIRHLIKPLEFLTRHIENLPQETGDDRFLSIKTKDEIGTLSLAFNKMVTEIDKRSAELSGANSALHTEISERKQAEEKLKRTLAEKETLLREIHHRVKNNMAVVSSLLSLEARKIKDATVKALFEESQQRVKAMALVHEKLYQTKDLSSINFEDYIRSIISEIISLYRIDTNAIFTVINIVDIELDLEAAVPCGLIINELLTNAFKHAFPDNRRGVLSVNFSKTDHAYTLAIKDNGVGLPEGFDYKEASTLGLQLVNVLTGQLNGTLQIRSDKGTEVVVTFKTE